MKKLYCVICGKHRKFKNPKISCVFRKKNITCSKCGNEDEKMFEEG